MKTICPALIGRLGNNLSIYAKAKALAEQEGHRFVCPPWMGQRLFDLNDEPLRGKPDILVDTYCNHQRDMIYTKADCQRWFRFRKDVTSQLPETWPVVAAHLRRGDYEGYGYPMVSKKSYLDAAGINGHVIDWFYSEEAPFQHAAYKGWASFIPDFYGMTKAKMFYRANSSFSWWAANLSDAEVWSPIIAGLEGGKEHDCQFVRGNWPRFCDRHEITDLHMKET